MTFVERILPGAGQLQWLKQAAENKHGMMALVIPFAPDFGQEASADPSLPNLPDPGTDRHSGTASAISLAEKFLRMRRQRENIFPSGLFADPSWDMLLDLFIARANGARPISTSSLCIAAAVPATTALRWIALLVQQGLFCKYADPKDRRRIFIGLTDEGWQKMHRLLTTWAEKI